MQIFNFRRLGLVRPALKEPSRAGFILLELESVNQSGGISGVYSRKRFGHKTFNLGYFYHGKSSFPISSRRIC